MHESITIPTIRNKTKPRRLAIVFSQSRNIPIIYLRQEEPFEILHEEVFFTSTSQVRYFRNIFKREK